VNSENIDEFAENLRHVSQNLKEFTNTIKTGRTPSFGRALHASTRRENLDDPGARRNKNVIRRKANGGKEKESLGLQPARL